MSYIPNPAAMNSAAAANMAAYFKGGAYPTAPQLPFPQTTNFLPPGAMGAFPLAADNLHWTNGQPPRSFQQFISLRLGSVTFGHTFTSRKTSS